MTYECDYCDFTSETEMGISVHEGKKHEKPYRDESVLRELYHDQCLSMKEVADECDCAVYTVQRWFDRHGIETRQAPQDPTLPAHHRFEFQEQGGIGQAYELVSTWIDGRNWEMQIHRLIAVAYGKLEPNEVWDESIHIHHKSGHGLDNRPENLERLTESEHATRHKLWEY